MIRSITLGLAIVCGMVVASARAGDLSETIDTTQARVVKIFGAGGLAGLQAYGTGVLISPEGHIATVWSHILDSDAVTVVLSDGRRFYAEVLGTDIEKDVAVVKIEAEGLPFFDLSRSVEVSPGSRILAFSNMFKVASGGEPLTVQRGVIAAKTSLAASRGRFQAPYRGPAYVVDAVTNNPGAAGGVITTLDGRLVGMIGRELKNSQTQTWINYAVPFSELRDTINAIKTGDYRPKSKFADTPAAAVKCTPIDLGLVLVPDVVARTPPYIDEVLEGTPAAKAGLVPEDLVVFVNSVLVGSISTFNDTLGQSAPGDDVQITVRRGDELIAVTLRVPQPAAAAAPTP